MAATTNQPNLITRARIALNVFRSGYPRAVKQAPFLWPAYRQGNAQWQIVDFNSYITDGFQLNTLIYSAIMYKVRSAYYAPLRAYSGDENHPEVLPLDHPLAALAHRPNSYQSAAQFMGANTVYLNVAGNSYILLDRPNKNALPSAMYPLRPDRVFIIPGDRNIKGYLYVPEGRNSRDGIPILPEDLIHVRLPNPGDPLEGMGYGLSPFAAMARSADVDNAVTNYLKLFFQKGTAMNVYLKFDVPMDDATISQVKHRFQEIYEGYEKWADVGVIDQGGSIESFGQTFKEMGFEAIDDRNESRVLGPFGVPGILIGTRLGVNRAINANAKELRAMFWEDTMLPELGLHEAEYQYFLRSDDGAYVMFDTSKVPALRKDIATTVNAWAQLVGLGVPKNTAAEVVGLELGNLPDGDVVYMPLSLIPMNAKKPAQTVTNESAVPDATNPETQPANKKKEVKYSDDQPRDDSGRWSDTGGGGSSGIRRAGVGEGSTEGVLSAEDKARRIGIAKDAAKEFGFDPKDVEAGGQGYSFNAGNMRGEAAAEFNPATGKITIYDGALIEAGASGSEESYIKGLMAHEVNHAKFLDVRSKYESEKTNLLFNKDKLDYDKEVLPKYRKEYPTYNALHKYFDGDKNDALQKEDGVTDYSKAYWAGRKKKGDKLRVALDETLAEISYLGVEGSTENVSGTWNEFHNAVNTQYSRIKKNK